MTVATSTRRFAVGRDEEMVLLTFGSKSSLTEFWMYASEARELAELLTKAADSLALKATDEAQS